MERRVIVISSPALNMVLVQFCCRRTPGLFSSPAHFNVVAFFIFHSEIKLGMWIGPNEFRNDPFHALLACCCRMRQPVPWCANTDPENVIKTIVVR